MHGSASSVFEGMKIGGVDGKLADSVFGSVNLQSAIQTMEDIFGDLGSRKLGVNLQIKIPGLMPGVMHRKFGLGINAGMKVGAGTLFGMGGK